jgi:hypothetical protein
MYLFNVLKWHYLGFDLNIFENLVDFDIKIKYYLPINFEFFLGNKIIWDPVIDRSVLRISIII